MSESERARKLIEHLRARRDWYGRLAELAREQKKLIRDDPDGLLEFLERKKAVMAQLEQVSASMPNARAEWDEIRGSLSPTEAKAVEAELAAVAAVLEEVMKEEEEGRKLAEEARAATAGELRQSTSAQQAATAYRAKQAPPPRYLDRNE